MRLLICAGGTGGGVYPALAVLQTLEDNTEMLWVGGVGGMESELVQRASIPFETIPAAGLHGVGLRRMPHNLLLLIQGIFASRRIIKRFKPDVILLTGGYIAVPMAVAAGKIPVLVFVPDIEPGLAIKTVANFASKIALTSSESKKYFSTHKETIETGYPTRTDLSKWTKESARNHFKLTESKPVLLIFGGSKGARSINSAILNHLSELLEISQVIHISGELDWEKVKSKKEELPKTISPNYHCFPYLHEEMGAALTIADLVISRAGASIIGEYPLFSLPAILIPYPHAWRYQAVNAQYLVKHHAAVIVEDSKLEEDLLSTIKHLLNEPEGLMAMRKSMQALYRPKAAQVIGQQLVELAGERS